MASYGSRGAEPVCYGLICHQRRLIRPCAVAYGTRASSAARHRRVTRLRYGRQWPATEYPFFVASRYDSEYHTAHMDTMLVCEGAALENQPSITACSSTRALGPFCHVALPV